MVYFSVQAGIPSYVAYVRLDRPLPRVGGSLRAGINLAGYGVTEPPTRASEGFFSIRSSRGRHCYGQSFAVVDGDLPPALSNPGTGRLVPVELLIRGVEEPVRRWTRMRMRSPATSEEAAVRRLGCVAPRR